MMRRGSEALRMWLGAVAVVLAVGSAQCEREPPDGCQAQCDASDWYDTKRKARGAHQCHAACIAACGCGFLPSPLGEDPGHFMDVCMQSESAVREQVTDCMRPCDTERRGAAECQPAALQSDAAWGCGEQPEEGGSEAVCRAIESCLLEEFDASVIGRARVFMAFYDSSADESLGADADCEACAEPAAATSDVAPATCEIYAGSADSEEQSFLLPASGRVNPCEKVKGTFQIQAERGPWVIPLMDFDCGAQQTSMPTLITRDVPMGDFEYVARVRGIDKSGTSVCLTARRELVGKAGADVQVRFDMPFGRGTWQCEDDLAYCKDGLDDDEDGDVDCEDLDCASFCGEFSKDLCRNGVDDDDDGATDCADHECTVLCESSKESCEDGLDNDDDEALDCADDDCGSFCEVGIECKDDADNDGDGDIDCDDEDCECGPRRTPVRMGA